MTTDHDLTPEEMEAAWQEALSEASRAHGGDWHDDSLAALGPGPGWDDTAENNDRPARKGGDR